MPDTPLTLVPAQARTRRIPLPGGADPTAVLRALADDRHPAALSGDWLGGPVALTILSSEPLVLAPSDADPFTLLDDLPAVGENPEGALAGGGWIGWLGYRLGECVAPGVLGPPPPAALDVPPAWLAFYDHLVICEEGRWFFEMLETPERADALAAELARWRRRLAALAESAGGTGHTPAGPASRTTGPELTPVGAGAAGHLAAVLACGERVAAGDLYQANLCLGLAGAWDGDAIGLLARALERTQPRFGAAVGGVVSLSPERFLRRTGGTVWTEPIKGTRPRTGEPRLDAVARSELEGSAKDAAEHVMIVDLMRNDLGRICRYGSVTAEPPRTEAHSGVWQLVSTVSGRLRPGVTNAELLRATFPPGSVTGAPKIAAMQLISELEGTRREAYTGAVGIASPVAGLDLNVAIRTFELTSGRIWLGVGGGIVADSDPEEELAEALVKARGTLSAVGGRVSTAAVSRRTLVMSTMSATPANPSAPARRALEFGSRPDPAEGVLETLLAHNGRPQFLTAHLERLAGSVERLYGHGLPENLPGRTSVAGAGLSRARVRLLARPDGTIEIDAKPEPTPLKDPPALRLAPWLLPGGLGADKWIDRRLLAALGEAEPATVPLLLDGDGTVLEAGYANVWIVEAGTWITPPADGRILPGVTRALLLANPTVSTREEQFDLARLKAADAVFLTSAISGRRQAVLVS